MMFSPSTKNSPKAPLLDRLTIYIGGLILLVLVLGSWFPLSCSYIKRAIVGCPTVIPFQTDAEKELSRITHQDLTKGLGVFSVKASSNLTNTAVRFTYRADYDHQIAFLQVEKSNGVQQISLITDPLLVKLNWPRLSTTAPVLSLYQRNGDSFSSLTDFSAHLPSPTQLAADIPAAQALGLQQNQFQQLDKLSSLDGINYILTTFTPQTTDGTWRNYAQNFNISDAKIVDGKINWSVNAPTNPPVAEPFRLGEMHIDYQERRP